MLAIGLFLVLVVTAAVGEEQKDVYGSELRLVTRIYQDCSKSDWTSCLKMKLASALDRISKNYKVIHLLDGVSFVNEKTSSEDWNQPATEENYLKESRENAGENSSPDVMLVDRFIRFLSTYTLHVKFSNLNGIKNSIDEARGKYGGKKYGYFLFLPLMMAGTVLPLAFGALALLAGKALIISKLALLLAGIIGLKKLFTISHHDHHSHHGGYHERQFRSMDDVSGSDGQNLAYRGQK